MGWAHLVRFRALQLLSGQPAAVRERQAAALAAFRRVADPWGVAYALVMCGAFALVAGDFNRARTRHAYGAALLVRGLRGDATRDCELLRQALAAYDALGMEHDARNVRTLRACTFSCGPLAVVTVTPYWTRWNTDDLARRKRRKTAVSTRFSGLWGERYARL